MLKLLKQLVKKSSYRLPLASLFFLVIFLVGCNRNQDFQAQISKEDKIWMNKFFHDLLFVERGGYTIWGSKPITEIVLFHFTDSEWEKGNASLTPDELKNCYVCDPYDLPENWERWERIASNFEIHDFLLFRSHFSEDGKCSFVYLVNVLATAQVIQKHYQLFADAVGFDFHPLEVTLQMPDKNSRFWREIRNTEKAPLLWGILFGFGEKNALAFYWKHFDKSEVVKKYFSNVYCKESVLDPIGRVIINKKNFEIPGYISFFQEDPVETKYESERKKIKKIYAKGNLVDITLRRLCTSSNL